MLTPIFTYSLDDFCERYNIDRDYTLSIVAQKYPLLTVEPELIVLLSEVDLLVLLGVCQAVDFGRDDPRVEAKIRLYPN